MKIGVTFGSDKHKEHAHVTGILQNVVNLATCLNNIHDVVLVNTVKDVDNTQKFKFNIYDYPIESFHQQIADDTFEYDVFIILGGEIMDVDVDYIRNNYDTKIVYYNCSAKYQTHIIDIIFERSAEDPGHMHRSVSQNYHEVWTIPQNYKVSSYFLDVIHNVKTKSIPFLYDPKFIDLGLNDIGSSFDEAAYMPNDKDSKRISIMEPNRDWLKSFTHPLLIAESVFRREPNLISQISLNNLKVFKENSNLKAMLNKLEIWENEKTTSYINDWFPVYEYLKDYTDVVVSHQWDNPLNYYYLDIAYLRYPLIHNAHMCKDIGYYYEGWDFKTAEDKLIEAIKFHDDNLELYDYQVDRILNRFSPNNEKTISTYKKLINNLFMEV